jgi:hypothetical protein
MKNKSKLKVSSNGNKSWWLDGLLHREDGPAMEDADGYKSWYLNGECHREDGPAIEWDKLGQKEWYLNNKRYSSHDEWFKALTSEQQYNYLWNLDNE